MRVQVLVVLIVLIVLVVLVLLVRQAVLGCGLSGAVRYPMAPAASPRLEKPGAAAVLGPESAPVPPAGLPPRQ